MGLPNYTKLFTYWYSLIIYDRTVEFCKRWVKSWKLSEQMTGAARSGKQNIVEGSEVFGTSLKSVIKLTNVARGSIEELIGDLEDFLRQQSLKQWSKDDSRIVRYRQETSYVIRNLSNIRNIHDPQAQKLILRLKLPNNPESAANFLLTLCHQASMMLRRQVESLENKHEAEGGYTEKLYRKRKNYRGY
jgi:four helix bundle suffix protein